MIHPFIFATVNRTVAFLFFCFLQKWLSGRRVWSLQHAKQSCEVDKMSLTYWCLERKRKSASQFPSWEQSLVYLRLSLMIWVNKASTKSAASAKRRGFTTALEAAWESRVILTNWIWHNLDAVLMRTVWNGDTINPLESQKEKGLNWPFLCGKSDLLTSRDLSQPTSLGSPGQGLGVTGTSGLCCYEEKQSYWAVRTNATAKMCRKSSWDGCREDW